MAYDQFSGDSFSNTDTVVQTQQSQPATTINYQPAGSGSTSTITFNGSDSSDGGSTLVLTQSNGGSGGMSSATVGSISATDTKTNVTTGSANYTLHETGTLGNGSYSLNCIMYDGSAQTTFSSTDYASSTAEQTNTNGGNQSNSSSGVDPSVSNSGQSSGTVTAFSTVTANSTASLSGQYAMTVHEEGRFAAGSFSLSSFTLSEQASSQEANTTDSTSNTTSNTQSGGSFSLAGILLFSGGNSAQGTSSSSDNLSCYQEANLCFTEAGSYANYQFSLNCFNLTAGSSISSAETINQSGSDATSGTNSNGTFSGGGTNSLYQAASQSQAGTVTEQGTYAGGSFALNVVNFSAEGTQAFTYNKSSNESWSGKYSGNDNFNVTSSGTGTYSSTGMGQFANGSLSLMGCQLQGGANSNFNLQQSGTAGTVNYSHSDNWSESNSLNASGSNQGSNGWQFSSYNSTFNQQDSLSDQVASRVPR